MAGVSVIDPTAAPYNAVGNGVTDDTAALEAALAATPGGGVFFLPNRVFIHNRTLVPADGVRIISKGGNLKAGSAKTGELATHGRQIKLFNVNDVLIDGVIFPAPATAFSTAEIEQATIWVGNSIGCRIRNNHLSSTHLGSGIFVGGEDSVDNRVEDNYLSAAGGIQYSYAGASRTLCRGNQVLSALTNGLTGTGNGGGSIFNEDCIVENNQVVSPGRMGIEDQSQCRGTIIRGNVVRSSADFGISVPNSGCLVEGNTLIDPTGYGIEAFTGGCRILNNQIRYVSGTPATAIFLGAGGATALKGGEVLGNYIEHAGTAVELSGAVKSALVMGNTIVNPVTYGIRSNTSSGHVTIVGNQIRWTSALSATSTGVVTSNAFASVIGNTFACESGMSGGSAGALGVRPLADYTIIQGNVFDGASLGGSDQFTAIATVGGGPTGLRILNNVLLGGAVLDISSMIAPLTMGNTGTVSGVDSRVGFYGVTPVARASIAAVGSDAATTQTLANDLRSKLISLGLIQA